MQNKIIAKISILFIGLISFALAKPILNVKQWQAPEGAKIYFVKAPQIPMVDILVAFHAGSSRDGKLAGLANLTSSMIGEGTNKLSADQIADQLDTLGVEFNAETNKDMTVLHLRSLSDSRYLTRATKLFTTIISQADFPKKAFLRVQTNTLQAIALQQQNPSDVAKKAFSKTIFASSEYANPTLGESTSVKQISRGDIENFYKQYYVAKNMIIVIVGDINGFQAQAIGSEITEALPKGVTAPTLATVKNNPPKRITINFPANQTTIIMGEVGITYKDAINPALIVGNYILGSGMTSRLFNIVREKYGLTYGVGSYFIPLANRGAFFISLKTKNNQVTKALTITKDVLHNYLKIGPSAQELQAAKDYLIGSFPMKIVSNASIANFVLTSAFYHIPFNYLDTYKEKINAVTTLEAKTAMDKTVKPKNFVIVTVGGHGKKST